MVHQDRAAVSGIFTYYMAEDDQVQFPSIMPCSLELLVTFIHFHPLQLWHSVLLDRFFSRQIPVLTRFHSTVTVLVPEIIVTFLSSQSH